MVIVAELVLVKNVVIISKNIVRNQESLHLVWKIEKIECSSTVSFGRIITSFFKSAKDYLIVQIG